MEEEAPRPEAAPPPPTPPESPQLHEQEEPQPRASPAPSPAATPPEAKRAKAAPRQDRAPRSGSWAEAGGGSPAPSEGEGRPGSRGRGRSAEQMEIGPLQRMAREPDVELFKGYHSYAVRTSPVTPATDYEEEQFPENEPPSPEPRGEPQRRGGTPGPPQGREEKPSVAAEAKPEPPRPKEPQQRPSPERRAGGRAEPAADRKTEARAPGRTEPKAGAKRGPAQAAAVVAAQKAEECEEVTWGIPGSLLRAFPLLFPTRSGRTQRHTDPPGLGLQWAPSGVQMLFWDHRTCWRRGLSSPSPAAFPACPA